MSVPQNTKIEVTAKAQTWAFDNMKGEGVSHGSAAAINPLIGQAAPDFLLKTLEGEDFKLSESIGKKIIILDFWATWCGPCIKALPEVMAVAKAYKEQGVELITVNQQENPGKVKGFLRTRAWKMNVVMDSEGEVKNKYGVSGIPTTFIIGLDGKIATVHKGFQPGLGKQLEDDIKALLPKKK